MKLEKCLKCLKFEMPKILLSIQIKPVIASGSEAIPSMKERDCFGLRPRNDTPYFIRINSYFVK